MAILAIDFDGVLRIWDDTNTPTLKSRNNLNTGAISRTALGYPLIEAVTTGKIKKREWLLRTAAELNCSQKTIFEWAARRTVIDLKMLSIVRNLRSNGCKVILATNGTDELQNELVAFRIENEFDLILNSANIGFAKPNDEYFYKLISLAPDRSTPMLFVDDNPDNVAAAERCGIAALLYQASAPISEQVVLRSFAPVSATTRKDREA